LCWSATTANDYDYGEKVGYGKELFGTGVAYSDSDPTPTMLGRVGLLDLLYRRSRTNLSCEYAVVELGGAVHAMRKGKDSEVMDLALVHVEYTNDIMPTGAS
jgi:hypothetical protein